MNRYQFRLPGTLTALLCIVLAIGAFYVLANPLIMMLMFFPIIFLIGLLGASIVGWTVNAIWPEQKD